MAAMASAASRAAARLAVPAAAACTTAATYATYNSPNLTASPSGGNANHANHHVYCDASTDKQRQGSRHLPRAVNNDGSGDTVVLRKRMTSIGRFSMKSETPTNPSIPTFFIALSGRGEKNDSSNSSKRTSDRGGMSAAEFESAWLQRSMPSRHPRFHSRVSAVDDRYFEYETDASPGAAADSSSSSGDDNDGDDPKAELHRHVTETVHPGAGAYRSDLRKRIEQLLTEPIDLTDRLWEVMVSSGMLGSSGAVSRLKVDNLRREQGGATADVESLLLFRAHHSLADGVSLISALGDLVDEAEEIRSSIKAELTRRRERSRELSLLRRLLRYLGKLIWFTAGGIKAMLYQTYLLWTTPRNPFEEVLGLSSAADDVGKTPGRSVSWCDAAPLDEVKAVARSVGPRVTVNDVFVSCVAAAVARQLEEHRERRLATSSFPAAAGLGDDVAPSAAGRRIRQSSINVVVPVHLMGGAILPGRSVGNNIGAFVARVPADVHGNDDDPDDAIRRTAAMPAAASASSASDRLRRVHSSLDSAKGSPAPILSYLAARFASDCLPESLAKRLFRNANANAAVAVSNSRGFTKKIHINGRAVESSAGFLPLPPGIPVGVVVASYAGVVSLSVTAETWAVPDGDRFVGWMLEEYRRLCEECIERRGSK